MKRVSVLAVGSMAMFTLGGALLADDFPCFSLASECTFGGAFCAGPVTICDGAYVDRSGVTGQRGPLDILVDRRCRNYPSVASFVTIDCGSSPVEDGYQFTGCVMEAAGGGKICCYLVTPSVPSSSSIIGQTFAPSGEGCLN